MDRVVSTPINQGAYQRSPEERISFPTGITPLYRLEKGHELEYLLRSLRLENIGLHAQPVSLQLISIDFDRIRETQKSPYSFGTTALNAYQHLINIAYREKAHYK